MFDAILEIDRLQNGRRFAAFHLIVLAPHLNFDHGVVDELGLDLVSEKKNMSAGQLTKAASCKPPF